MGGYHSTLSVQKDGKPVASFCSFESKTCSKGHGWEIHKGELHPIHCTQLQKVIVKVCKAECRCKDECEAEIKKMNFVEKVLQECPKLREVFGICRIYKSLVDEPSTMAYICSPHKHKTSVEEGTPVLIQERVHGHIVELFHIGRENEELHRTSKKLPSFEEFIRASYNVSGGTMVISGMKGVVHSKQLHDTRGDTHASRKYILTSITVDSRDRIFGSQDRGTEGIEASLRFLKSPGSWGTRMRTPSAPPLEEGEEATEQDDAGDMNTFNAEYANRFNSLVHEATGTVHSTGGCMHKGVNFSDCDAINGNIYSCGQLFSMMETTGPSGERVTLQPDKCLSTELSSKDSTADLPPSYSSLYLSAQQTPMYMEMRCDG